MIANRPVSWFLSENGRKFTYAFATSLGIGFTAAKFAPHTFFIENYKKFVQYYSDGEPVELPKELRDRCESCLDLLKLSDVHRKLISPFSAYGYDLFHAGSTSSRFGVSIGIPVNFTYKSLQDIKKDNVKVNQKDVDWTSEIGQKLADALILPEKVQQFAICREILMTHTNKVLFEASYPFLCIFFMYNLTHYINKKLNLYAAPLGARITLYSIVGAFSIGSYFLMKDMTEISYEVKVDKQLCELGDDFIESGVIFYEKLLQRNQALRELMGDEGQNKYSKMGNENFFLRQPRMALVHRKQFFEQQLKNKSENKEAIKEKGIESES